MTRNSKIIIYDDSCPLCSAYTNAFIQTGLIDKEGRKNFSTIQPELIALIDIKRSVNEIPVIDTNTKQVWYGIDALLEVLSQKIPFIKPIGNIKPVKWLLIKLYRVISFNRRVIVANRAADSGFDCSPDFNTRYRIFFMILFLIINTWMLVPFQKYLLSASIFQATTIQQLIWSYGALVGLHIIIAFQIGKIKGIDYLGQINMLVLITILVTVPLAIINKYLLKQYYSFNNIYLAIAAVIILAEYIRRMNFVQIIPHYPAIIFIHIISMVAFIGYLLL